ncbi:MAG: VWA domain-containing protein [Gaiellaceae bacterium]
MSFGQPLLLLSLLVLPLAAGLFLLSERRRMRYAIRFTNIDVLATVVPRRSWRRYLAPLLASLALAALCLALARPREKQLVPVEQATVVLVLDTSTSMQSTDIHPTRMQAAEQAIYAFLRRVPKQVRVALILFAGDAQVAAPPTENHDLVRKALQDSSSLNGFGGTAIGDALATAVNLGRQVVPPAQRLSGTPVDPRHSPVSILFLSDGHQTIGLLRPLQGAELARRSGIPVNTIALGTLVGTSKTGDLNSGFDLAPDPETLSAIARATGGQFFAATAPEALRSAYGKLGSSIGRKSVRHEITARFVLAGALLLTGAGFLSRLWSPRPV